MTAELKQIIEYLVNQITSPGFPLGERAALRRLDISTPSTMAFLELLTDAGVSINSSSDDQLSRWATIVKAIAISAPLRNSKNIGRAMAEARTSEGRITTLLAARGSHFRSLVIRLVRQLIAHGQTCNWLDLSYLILTEQNNEESAERTRMSIAKNYFQAKDKLEK